MLSEFEATAPHPPDHAHRWVLAPTSCAGVPSKQPRPGIPEAKQEQDMVIMVNARKPRCARAHPQSLASVEFRASGHYVARHSHDTMCGQRRKQFSRAGAPALPCGLWQVLVCALAFTSDGPTLLQSSANSLGPGKSWWAQQLTSKVALSVANGAHCLCHLRTQKGGLSSASGVGGDLGPWGSCHSCPEVPRDKMGATEEPQGLLLAPHTASCSEVTA